ncbi:hypothetical protein KC19_VG018000 [Ceratodon purpureus]|uniref:Ribonuclease H1 N-terminal domain-containing protein n=1 Tax=Ceratodon purpureus TaxID=3225 RepID=A0A8T0HL38_CERPU|nr:hypothetical protein KC19_VG018000 [Ceratodon purpureus]
MDDRITAREAVWGSLRAIALLLKQIYISLFNVVDGAVARRGRGVVASNDRGVVASAEYSAIGVIGIKKDDGPIVGRIGGGKPICEHCDDFWFEPHPIVLAEFNAKATGQRGKKFYAVKKGTRPGIYATWREYEDKVKYFSRVEFKGF